MERFEEVLDECLEGLRSGRLTLEGCLSRYPRWAEHLEPLLRTSVTLAESLAEDTPETAVDPAYRTEARRQFLTADAARRLAAPKTWYRRFIPALSIRSYVTHPLMSAALAFLIGFVGFSSYTVITAKEALPGDWRYPVKRAGEQVRLRFAFDEDARRGLQIAFAEERLNELERLASGQRSIPEPVLRDLTSATDSLDDDLDSVPQQDIERIGELAHKQQETLLAVVPLVEPEAKDDLQVALETSGEVYEGAVHALAVVTASPGNVPPEAAAEATSEATPKATSVATGEARPETSPTARAAASSTAEVPTNAANETPTPEAGATSEAQVETEPTAAPPEPTPVIELPTPTPAEPAPTPPPPSGGQVVSLSNDTTAGIAWDRITIGDFSLTVPAGTETDWAVSTLPSSGGGDKILVGHRSGNLIDAAVVIQMATGASSIHVLVDGTLWRVESGEALTLLPPSVSDALFHILESISRAP